MYPSRESTIPWVYAVASPERSAHYSHQSPADQLPVLRTECSRRVGRPK